MVICFHRYSLVKRWISDNTLFIIQRCRKCDEWKRRSIRIESAESLNPEIESVKFNEKLE